MNPDLLLANVPTLVIVGLGVLYNSRSVDDMRDLLRAEVRAGVAEIRADLAEIRQRIDRLEGEK